MAKGKQDLTKTRVRDVIKSLKAQYDISRLEEMSRDVFEVVEITGFFQSARTVFIYNSLPDEVATQSFVMRWAGEKNFYLPVVEDDNLIFREYTDFSQMKEGVLGIREPIGKIGVPSANDLIIVPGIAFDRKMNRLGRGKGFYDRFLCQTKATKMGVCFDFQLLDVVPVNEHDVKMDVIVSENDLIW